MSRPAMDDAEDTTGTRGPRKLPNTATDARPGPDKVAVMRQRHSDGVQLHHPDDRKMDSEDERPSFHTGRWFLGDGVVADYSGCDVGGDFE